MPTAFFVVIYAGTALALIAALFFVIATARIQHQIDQERRRAKTNHGAIDRASDTTGAGTSSDLD